MTTLKPYLLQTLKEIALLGGSENTIEVSSKELAQRLQTSQQTASRYLVELDAKHLISRQLGVKKQLIHLTTNGQKILKQEYHSFQQIFEMMQKVHFKGRLVSGLGEGKYYTSQTGYVQQFEEKLGFKPYPGTLNIEIEYLERNKIRLLRHYGGIEITAYKTKKRTFGGVLCFHAELCGTPAAIVIPLRSHYSRIIEFISPYYLREKLNLTDGDLIESIVYLQPKNVEGKPW